MNKSQILLIVVSVAVVAALVGASLYMGVAKNDDNLQVVASFYPLAYMAKEIGGERVTVKSLIPYNTEVHAWQPSPGDIVAADEADVLLYNGAGLDEWFEEDILPALGQRNRTVVETTDGISLLEPSHEPPTRMFLFDNDNGVTDVYDMDNEGHSALHTSLTDVACDVLPKFSGYFDTPPLLETSQGYWYIFSPRQDEVVVINTGVHGDHFHDAEVLTRMDSGKPIHPAVSPDGKYVAFSEDSSKKTLVIEVSAPAIYNQYDNGGTQTASHATIAFDGDNRLYSGDMKSPQGSNLMVIDPATGSELRTGDAGKSPHGAVYSPLTEKIYFNTADGIHISNKDSDEGNFSYQHTGFKLVRSWMTQDGKLLVSYVRNLAMGIEYDAVVVYDVTTKSLVREIDVNITAPALADHGYANSEFVPSKNLVLLGDPELGKVHIINIMNGDKTSLQMEGSFPQSLRITVDNHGDDAWVVTKDGHVSRICLEDLEVETTYQLEKLPGVNFVIAAVKPEHHDHEVKIATRQDDHDHGIVDPHTWVSPFIARQQAENIYKALVEADPDGESYYTPRWEDLSARMSSLDGRYSNELATKTNETIVVAHAAYGYLAHRYGFEQHGVIGMSADQQPSASALTALVDLMEDEGVRTLYVDPIYSDAYIQTLKTELQSRTGGHVHILKLYLMLGPTEDLDYLEQMEQNLENLKFGLTG